MAVATLAQCQSSTDVDTIRALAKTLSPEEIAQSIKRARNRVGLKAWQAMTEDEQHLATRVQLLKDYPLAGILARNGARIHMVRGRKYQR